MCCSGGAWRRVYTSMCVCMCCAVCLYMFCILVLCACVCCNLVLCAYICCNLVLCACVCCNLVLCACVCCNLVLCACVCCNLVLCACGCCGSQAWLYLLCLYRHVLWFVHTSDMYPTWSLTLPRSMQTLHTLDHRLAESEDLALLKGKGQELIDSIIKSSTEAVSAPVSTGVACVYYTYTVCSHIVCSCTVHTVPCLPYV